MFEQKHGEFVAPADYVRHALATVTTHDLPTLHGWWSGHDIDLWEKLGFYADAAGARPRAPSGASRSAQRLLRALRREQLWPRTMTARCREYSAELARAVHAYLGAQPRGPGHRAARGHDRHAGAREHSRHQQPNTPTGRAA